MQRIFKAISERPTNPAFDTILTEQRQRPYVRRNDNAVDAEEQDMIGGGIKGQVAETTDTSALANQEKNGTGKNAKGRMRGRIIHKDRNSDRDAATEEKSEGDDREQDSAQRQMTGSGANVPARVPSDAGQVFLDPKAAGATMRIEVNDVVSSMIATVEQRPYTTHQAKRGLLDSGKDTSILESKKRARVDYGDHL